MTILVVGYGKVGKPLLGLLLEKGFDAYATTTRPEKKQQHTHLLVLDALDLRSFREVVTTLAPSTVVLALSPTHQLSSQETKQFFLNSTCNALRVFPPDTNILLMGSVGVYGNHSGRSIDEETPLLSQTEKGQLHIEVQQMVLNRPNSAVFRLGGLYDEQHNLVEQLHKFSGVGPGFPDRVMNFTHTDDVARAVVFAISQKLTGVYNVVSFSETAQTLMPSVTSWSRQNDPWRESNFDASSSRLHALGFEFQYAR